MQKNYTEEDKGEKVHIPETFKDSESDSDLGDKIRRLEGFGDSGQGSSKGNDGDVCQIWCLESNPPNLDPKQVISGNMKLKDIEEPTLGTEEQLVSLGNQKPTEMDFSNEAIVNTQESIVAEEVIAKQDGGLSEKAPNLDKMIKNDNMKLQATRSERLKKDITRTTQDNYERMARKRNLEGTPSSSTMFSYLPIQSIKDLSSDMGINAELISFGTFNMIKDLGITRKNLHAKQHEVVSNKQNDEVVADYIDERLIECLQDELSETESEILALSKNRGKLSKRKLKISSNSKSKSHVQEAPGLKKREKEVKLDFNPPNKKRKRLKNGSPWIDLKL